MADNNSFTLLITHSLQPGQAARYEQWLEKTMPIAARFPGHLGVHVIRPTVGNSTYNVVIRFDTLEHLNAWVNSPERQALVEEIGPVLNDDDKVTVHTEAAFWFTPESTNMKQPPRWKQFLITLLVIFPSTNLIPWITEKIFPQLHGTLGLHFINDACVVMLVVWLWMPMMTRLFASWLKK
ncbi:antibiotic biosynthesis monooxygenase [Budvicia diplopodorum]|uniref:antibiotic biosynthesis monooxygenase n=1 Tax=Budvicia diplopodorum TaxID=1119056 RepID=UPI001356B7B8|nr:antibiotic biosynthesis monooxygenase [Budvicia diplopodorum]